MKPKHLLITLLAAFCVFAAQAASVKVTMNAVSTTMKMTPKGSETPVETGDPTNKVYTFDVAPGEYTITGIATNGTTVNGSIDVTVTDAAEVQEFTVLTITTYATNKTDGVAWTIENGDYTIGLKVCSREGVLFNSTVGKTTTAGRYSFLALSGHSYYVEFIPSEAHQAENYVTLYKNGTLTANTTASGAIPLSDYFTITVPQDASLLLARKEAHFVDFKYIAPISESVVDGQKALKYRLAYGQVYNYRTWMKDGLTQGGYFSIVEDVTKRPELNFTESDYKAFNPQQINHNVQSNEGYETGDIFLNINPQGHLKLNVGDVHKALAMRTWELTDNSTNNYFIEPDFHYTVIGLDGQPSTGVVEIEQTAGSAWANVKAVGAGTAIVLVTYDAIGLNKYSGASKSAYLGGEYWGAIWPENTGVYVVTVGQTDSSAAPNMVINEKYNEETKKMAGKYVDAEHDVFYYLDSESAVNYTFKPEGIASVAIAYPTIGERMASYSGFSSEGVTANADGSYTLLLKEGRQIVKLTDTSGNTSYQVLTAKPCHREITNATRPGSNIYQPGDEVKIQYSGLRHPANKIAGIYNMSAYVTYNGIPNGTSLILGSGQYTFGSAASAQAVTISIPADTDVAEKPSIEMTEGVIQVNGYGDPIGNHRNIDPIAGRSPNFTAIAHKTFFGLIPDISIPLKPVKTFSIKVDPNVSDAKIDVYFNGTKIEPTDDLYSGTYGAYKVEGTKDGYQYYRNTFNIGDDAEGLQTFNVVMAELTPDGWNGTDMTEPQMAEGVYQISTGAELAWLANKVNTASTASALDACLVKDIDLSNFAWTPIGTTSAKCYIGNFNGNGHTVNGLYVERTNATYAGLFGYIKTATVSGVTVNGEVAGKQYVGGVVGGAYADSKIDRCVNHAKVSGTSTYVGGIVGYLYNNTVSLANCYNTGNISGTSNCGGVVGGGTNSAIENIYSIGDVAGTKVGACVGAAPVNGSITNAFSTKEYTITAGQTLVTVEQMHSGEVAYRLGEAFGQEIGKEDYPVLGGMTTGYDEDEDYYFNLVVLTFEDTDYKGSGNMLGKNDWTSLIDSPQYGGKLLYGDSGAGYTDGKNYWWNDENNTGLYSELNDAYGAGMPCYWSGGAAVSNYVSTDYKDAGFERQLEAYNPDGGKGGHAGSDNFIVLYGYDDDSPYSMDARPIFKFADGQRKVIDHLYMALNSYTINVMVNGNSLSEPVAKGDSVIVTFEGLDRRGKSLGTVRVSTLDENYKPILGYVKVDLSKLGKVSSLRVNMESNIDNGYGLSIPAYCILDDIAVRIPGEDDPEPAVYNVAFEFGDDNARKYVTTVNNDGEEVKDYAAAGGFNVFEEAEVIVKIDSAIDNVVVTINDVVVEPEGSCIVASINENTVFKFKSTYNVAFDFSDDNARKYVTSVTNNDVEVEDFDTEGGFDVFGNSEVVVSLERTIDNVVVTVNDVVVEPIDGHITATINENTVFKFESIWPKLFTVVLDNPDFVKVGYNDALGQKVPLEGLVKGENSLELLDGMTTIYVESASEKYEIAKITLDGEVVSPEMYAQIAVAEGCVVSVTSDEISGIQTIMANQAEVDVYNLNGILVRKAANAAEIEALPAGFYIVNGLKVYKH